MPVKSAGTKEKVINSLRTVLRNDSKKEEKKGSGDTNLLKENLKIARFLIYTFIENNGKMFADQVYRTGICSNGKYTQFRILLKDYKWIKWDSDEYGKPFRFYPGDRLLKYINRIKVSEFEIATTKDLHKLESKVDKNLLTLEGIVDIHDEEIKVMKDKIQGMEHAIDRIINIIDPPITSEKRLHLVSGNYDKLIAKKDERFVDEI